MKTDRHFHFPVTVLLALAAVFLWCTACIFYSTAISLCTSVAVKWEYGGISPAALVRQQTWAGQDGAADQPEATLWRIEAEQEIRNADKKSTTADVVAVFGDCRAITSANMLRGAFPARSDPSGCAVSSGLAFSLWGSTDVLGMPVKMEGDSFYVRGVFKGEESRIFHQAQAESKEPLLNMQLTFSGTGTRERAERYLLAAEFSGGMLLELPLTEWALAMLVRLPAILLAAGILVRILRRGKWLRHYPVLLAFWLPSALAVLAGLFYCVDLPGIPAGFIPTRWSDFEFWKNLFTGHRKALNAWILAGVSFRDMELMEAVLLTVLFSLAASVLAVTAARRAAIRTYGGMALGCMGYTLALSLLCIPVARTYNMLFCREMYLLPCLWLCVDFMLYRQGEKLAVIPEERRGSDGKSILQRTEGQAGKNNSIDCKEENALFFIPGEKKEKM